MKCELVGVFIIVFVWSAQELTAMEEEGIYLGNFRI